MAVGLYVFILFAVYLSLLGIHTDAMTRSFSHARIRRSSESFPAHISEKYKNSARVELYGMHHSYDRKPMSRLTMSCKNNAYKMILSDYPFAEVRWKHNGDNISLQPSRMVTSLNTLTIENLLPEDSGVYHCQLGLGTQTHIVVAVFSVVVGETIKHVAQGESLNLECPSYELGKIYINSTRFWLNPQGEETFRKPAKVQSGDIITSADDKSCGEWLCMVTDRGLGRKWLTTRIRVILDPAPPFSDKIRTYAKSHKTETIAVLFAGTFLLVLILNFFTKILDWKQKKFKAELDEIKKVLRINEETVGNENTPLLLEDTDETLTVYDSSDGR